MILYRCEPDPIPPSPNVTWKKIGDLAEGVLHRVVVLIIIVVLSLYLKFYLFLNIVHLF